MAIEVRTGFFPNGNINYEKMFLNNKPYGTWRVYFEKGGLYEEFSYDNKGFLNGIYRKWYPNGIIFSEITFKNNLHHGITREWHENGNILYEANFEEGEFKGTVRHWTEKGSLLTEKFYHCVGN
jgi:antitoxin component YwqK of YwqJK toxin-antitoxin module